MKLIRLTKDYYNELAEMIDEWREDQFINNTNHSPWAIFKNDYRDIDYYLDNLDCKVCEEGKVPSSTFFLYDEVRRKLIGAANIRHYLNESLLLTGGHIGDGIRPSERKKGYASLMIGMALEECKKLGINEILMTCNKNNIGSEKSIINNGGVFENEVCDEDGEIEKRFWIRFDNPKFLSEKLSSRFVVRKLGKCDTDDIYNLSIENELFYQYHPPLVTKDSITEDMKALPPGKAYTDKYYLGFFEGSKLVAVMDLVLGYPDSDTAFIGFFMVDKEYQGNGVGTSIIGETVEYLKECSYRKIRLGIDKGNPQSYHFWRKCGFKETDFNKYIVMELEC